MISNTTKIIFYFNLKLRFLYFIPFFIIGHISKWGEVKSRKSKKEQSSKNKQSGQQFGNAQRGHQKGGYSDRGRARGGK